MTKEALRNAALSRPQFIRQTVVHEGNTYEVRQPSVALRGEIMKAARTQMVKGKKGEDVEIDASSMDLSRMQAMTVICCTFLPGTDERLFDEADIDALLAMPAGGLFDKLSDMGQKLMAKKAEEAAKNSESVPTV